MIKLEAISSLKEDWLLQLAEWRSHPTIRPILLTPYVTASDLPRQKEWADRVIRSEAEHFFFIINPGNERKNDDGSYEPVSPLVGYCGLIHMHMIARKAEMSIMIAPEHMKKGYGTEAVNDLLHVGFMEFGLNCIYVECYDNTERWKFFQKLGFIIEGNPRATKYWEGRWWGSKRLSILREEYDINNNSSKNG